jgi:hypothetical protein
LARWHICVPLAFMHDDANEGNIIDQQNAAISEMDKNRVTKTQVLAHYRLAVQGQND